MRRDYTNMWLGFNSTLVYRENLIKKGQPLNIVQVARPKLVTIYDGR